MKTATKHSNHAAQYRRTRSIAQACPLDFTRNDYLGLSAHPALVQACQEAAVYGVGSAGSPVVCGYSHYHHRFEQAIAKWLGFEAAILVSNGYMANHIALQALAKPTTTVIADQMIHASVIDACQAYGVKLKRFRHQNIDSLEQHLSQTDGHKLVIVEGIYSVYGSKTDLNAVQQLCDRYQAELILDDAHGMGVLGRGKGSWHEASLKPEALTLLCCPLGKAFASYGAVLLGSELIIDQIVQKSRVYRYSTALPPTVAASNLAALSVLRGAHERRKKLTQNIAYFRRRALATHLRVGESDSCIQPIYFSSASQALQCKTALEKNGIAVYVMCPPTVPEHRCLIRVTLSSEHSHQDIDMLIAAMVAYA